MFLTDSLPDNPALLKALVSAQQAEIEHLKFIIAKFRRIQFGRSSEQMDETVAQLELALEELECVRPEHSGDDPCETEEAEPVTESEPALPAKSRPKRKPLPEHLPRETVEHLPAECACPACGGALKQLGEDIAEVLEYVLASFRVTRHVRPKLSCATCDRIVQATAPDRPIAKGVSGPGLLAHVLGAKYANHATGFTAQARRATVSPIYEAVQSGTASYPHRRHVGVADATLFAADGSTMTCHWETHARQGEGICNDSDGRDHPTTVR